MRDDPRFDLELLAACLRRHYGVAAVSIMFLPLGFDSQAAVYGVRAADGGRFFLRTRRGPFFAPGLAVPHALTAAGVPNVLAPLPTAGGTLSVSVDGIAGVEVALYPFIEGANAATVGLTLAQWRTFGATLRAVHDSGLEGRFAGDLRIEAFSLPFGPLLRQVGDRLTGPEVPPPAAAMAAVWRSRADRIAAMQRREEELSARLQSRGWDRVLCHTDIHAANILVGVDDRIWLIEWDGPAIAPRERDWFFVVGGRVARSVQPDEERAFFSGYGPILVETDAIRYARYERVLEDLAEFGRSVLDDAFLSDEGLAEATTNVDHVFAPGDILDGIEDIVQTWTSP